MIFYLTEPANAKKYPLSLHDALPISFQGKALPRKAKALRAFRRRVQMILQDPAGSLNPKRSVYEAVVEGDRKSTRLNSSHVSISYAVFCLKKKINNRSMVE